ANLESKIDPRNKFVVAVFTRPINNDLVRQLDSAGVKVIDCWGKHKGGIAYTLAISEQGPKISKILRNCSFFVNLAKIESVDKLALEFTPKTAKDNTRTIKATVYFHVNITANEARSICSGLVDSLIIEHETGVSSINIVASIENIHLISENPMVMEIVPYQEPKPLLFFARQLTGIDSIQNGCFIPQEPPLRNWLNNVQYTGDSIIIATNEIGRIKHLGFCEINLNTGDTVVRTSDSFELYKDWTNPGFGFGFGEHGVLVAGIAGGNGWGSQTSQNYPGLQPSQLHGVAPKALFTFHRDCGDVNNYSVTSDIGYYNDADAEHDRVLANHAMFVDPKYNNVGVFAAGNAGSGPVGGEYGLQQGYYSLLVNNKNGINVGASEKNEVTIADFSSIGPTRDGRIKPDIIAPGRGNLETGFYIEIDSVAIVNNGTKFVWNFGPGEPSFYDKDWSWHVSDTATSNGIFSFVAHDQNYTVSQAIFPRDTLLCKPYDTLVLRFKATPSYPNQVERMNLLLMWKRPSDNSMKNNGGIKTQITADGNWQNMRMPLNFLWTNNGYGDTVDRLRLDFNPSDAEGVFTCQANSNDYVAAEGTSIAAPFITGVVALMLQKFRSYLLDVNTYKGTSYNIHDNPPWNSTIRGILIHTAIDMIDTVGISHGLTNPETNQKVTYVKGPDWVTGWGFVNPGKALSYTSFPDHFLEDTLDQDSTKTYSFTVPIYTPKLRVTLCWDDPPPSGIQDQTTAYNRKLINNLDLYLRNVQSGTIYRPWVLHDSGMNDGTIPPNGLDSVITPTIIKNDSARHGIDTLNNVRVIDIDYPAAGQWEIVVSGDITQDQSTKQGINQDFSLIYDIKPDGLNLNFQPDSVYHFSGITDWKYKYDAKFLNTASTQIDSGATLNCSAGGEIRILPEFKAKRGGNLHFYIHN
ncbi:MAG: S8 family serine peptidase, partial [Smithella sp.]|nr:S8 family serine peptidase [Smithella sp.]